jgi:hypothetical protein
MKGNRVVDQQRMAEPTSESTIGLDLGDRWSCYCVIDNRGVVAKEDRVFLRRSAEKNSPKSARRKRNDPATQCSSEGFVGHVKFRLNLPFLYQGR